MNKSHKKQVALRQDKLPIHTTKRNHNIEKARLHLLGVCLLDSSYVHHLPATIHLTEYGAFTLSLIQKGLGLEAIIRHLEAVGLTNAQEIISGAFMAIPDGISLAYVFWNAVQVLTDKVMLA